MEIANRKKEAFIKWQDEKDETSRKSRYETYKALNKQSKSVAKRAKGEWWYQKGVQMEDAARVNNTKKLCRCINEIRKPRIRTQDAVLDEQENRVSDIKGKLKIWKNHFERLLNPERLIDVEERNKISRQNANKEVDAEFESRPTKEEVSRAIKEL